MGGTTSKKIHVHYFALLREQSGLSEETVSTTADDVGALYNELKARHGFTLEAEALRVVINDEFREWDSLLNEGDKVVFIPPVAGG